MFVFYALALLLFAPVKFAWSATPYKSCSSQLGTIQAFDVTGCTTAPCIFTKGNTYSMSLTFQSKASSNGVHVSIHGIIGGIPLPFPLPDADACKLGAVCPVKENDVNTVTMSLPVLSSYPSLSLYVKIELVSGDKNEDYACLQFPATIKGGSNILNELVGWKKGKLFELLD